MSFISMDKDSHKSELNEIKMKALKIFKTKLINIEKSTDEDNLYLQEALKQYEIFVTKMSEEDKKITTNYYSINHFCLIAKELKNIQKSNKSDSLNQYILDIYKIMQIIHKAHINSFKWKEFTFDKNFIEKLTELS